MNGNGDNNNLGMNSNSHINIINNRNNSNNITYDENNLVEEMINKIKQINYIIKY